MTRLGVLEFDASHCVEFTKRLDHPETLELVEFMESTNRIRANHGAGEAVKV
jgi:hypothetical protein